MSFHKNVVLNTINLDSQSYRHNVFLNFYYNRDDYYYHCYFNSHKLSTCLNTCLMKAEQKDREKNTINFQS